MTDTTLEEFLASGQIKTPDPQLAIQVPDQKLAVGQHRFSLQVVDDSGNSSSSAIVTVVVVDTTAPTAVLDLRDEQGRQIIDGRIEYGSGFILDGSRSVDIGGTISEYIWEILPQ